MAEEKEKPLTRDDVIRLIKENGDTAEGLDLSGKRFEEGIDLSKLVLKGIILKEAYLSDAHLEGASLRVVHLEGAYLWDAHLEGTDLPHAHLEKANLMGAHLEGAKLGGAHLERANLQDTHLEGASLRVVHLEGAYLWDAHLEGADLYRAHLEGVSLWGATFSPDTRLESVHWGNYILGEEKEGRFGDARDAYRRLKVWYTQAGMYDEAGKFFYCEMTVKRKASWWGPTKTYHLRELFRPFKPKEVLSALFPRKPLPWIRLMLYDLLCGYGEKPWKAVISAAVVVLGLAAAYFFWGSFSSSSFWDTLYYSATSFTALGYGQWAPQPMGWAKGVGAAEAIIGVFLIALFLVTFTRKMTR